MKHCWTFHQLCQWWNFLSNNETLCLLSRKVEVSFDFSSIFPTMKLFVKRWNFCPLNRKVKHHWTFLNDETICRNVLSNNETLCSLNRKVEASLDFSSIFPTMKTFCQTLKLLSTKQKSQSIIGLFTTMKLFVVTFCPKMKHFVH